MINHLACVMDGNRRWAKKFNLPTLFGHRSGVDIIDKVIKFCFAHKIQNLSLYTWSIENFSRSQEEKDYLFALIAEKAEELLGDFIKNNIRVRFIGHEKLFPVSVQPTIMNVQEKTAHLTGLHLNVLFCYGGRQEILEAVKKIAHDVAQGTLKQEDITQETIYKNLWLGDVPEPELIIFTGRMEKLKRLSNFLLYQAAYSELYYADCLWPELTEEHLEDAFNAFAKQKRNFGK